jgi:hypothetical protein
MSTHIQITLPDQYPYVLAVTCAITFHCLIVGFGAGSKRRTLFNSEFMNKHFENQHQKEMKEKIPSGGYPDCGNGVYSDKLSYKDWF